MILPRIALIVLSLAASSLWAQSMWKWRDANGTLQISDQAPPISVPEKNILSRPGGQRVAISAADAAASEPAAAAPGVPASGGDADLEARKRKIQADKAAAEAKAKQGNKLAEASRKADDCQRARSQLAMLNSGQRVTRPNAQGEREFLDDAGRAAEISRSQRIADAACRANP
jgi:hypothetical protein